MANNWDSNSFKLISSSTASRNKLLKLADGIKTRKKSSTHSITTSPNNKKNSSASLVSSVGYDRALTNIEHLVFGTYKARPSTPLFNDDNQSYVPSVQSQTNSPISQTNNQINDSSNLNPFCECRAHSRSQKTIDSHNNDNNKGLKFPNLTPNKRCNDCKHVLHKENENELDLTPTYDDMDIGSNCSSKEDESLISAVQQLSTNERSNGINSKIPQSISKKQNRNWSTSAINTSKNYQRSSDSLNSLLSNVILLNKEVDQSAGSDVTKETNGSKPMSKISQIPIPLTNVYSGLKSCEFNKPIDSCTDKSFISNQLMTKKLTNSPLNERSLEMPVIPNLHLLKNSQISSFGTPISRTSDLRFAKIRSTINANKRMPSLYTNQIRRHNSLDTTHKSFNSYQTRFKQTKVFTDESIVNNSRIIKESRITNTSIAKSQFSTFSTETRRISTSKPDKSGVNHSASYSKVIESFSSQNNEALETTKREVIKTKSHSNLQRNRPQVKAGSARIRVPMKSRSNSVPDSKALPSIDRVNRAASDSTPNSSQKSQFIDNNDNYATNLKDSKQMYEHLGKSGNQFNNKSYNANMMKMFIMDEDNIPVSPKKLSNTDYMFRQKVAKNKSKEEKCSDKTFKQYFYETYIDRVPSSAQNSPQKQNTPPIVPLRSRSSSDHQLSSFLLSKAQKEAIDDIKKPMNDLHKTSRPWSHIYSESEVKRILKATKDFGGVVTNSGDFVNSLKPKSENDILTTGVELNPFINEKLPINTVKSHSQSPTPLDNSSQESVLQRFKKTFSLRFSRNGVHHRSDSPVQTKLRSSLRSKSEEKHDETQTTKWYDVNNEGNNEKNDEKNEKIAAIHNENNRRLSNVECEDLKNKLIQIPCVERQFSTPYPIKARDQTTRKSLIRKHSNRSRLKRSMSHPHNYEKWSTSNKTLSRESSGRLSSETESECESSSGNQRSSVSRQSSEQQEFDDDVVYAEALWDHMSLDPEELSFRAGEVIDITDSSDKDWWWGAINVGTDERCGWFPASFVRMRVSQDDTLEECLTKIADGTLTRTPKKRLSISKLSNEQVRANVVLEIINTERDFVKHLKDVIDGYLKPCRNRPDMFTETRISTIFSNIEQLYEFQRNFLDQLELAINWEHMSYSLIGDCFLKNENEFIVYCEFCKNHPLAISELQDLYSDEKYVGFFEGCRLIQNMIDISLDGFLLTPIQKICKYPLQLGELLKYTRIDHEDYIPVTNAYACMQRVAQLVNERKRRFESLEQLIALQESIDGWEGLPLIETCSVLIHSGEVNRLTSSSWTKDVTLFLFDHLLIYCKKDTGILKKSSLTYAFKSRIDLDTDFSIIDIEDGTKDSHFNIIAKNAFKFYSESKQKWYLFQTKTSKDKENWLKAFDDERKRVSEDLEQGFIVTEKDKKGAKMAHLNSLKPKRPRIKRPSKSRRPDTAVMEMALDPPNGFEIDRNRAGSLPSYMHSDKSVMNSSKLRQPVIKKNRSNWFHLGSNKKTNKRIKRSLK